MMLNKRAFKRCRLEKRLGIALFSMAFLYKVVDATNYAFDLASRACVDAAASRDGDGDMINRLNNMASSRLSPLSQILVEAAAGANHGVFSQEAG